jgi:hypothetical protein
MALFGHGAMSDLSPLCAPKRTFGFTPHRNMCDEYQRAFKNRALPDSQTKGYVIVHFRTNAFAYVIHDLYGVRKAFRLFSDR